MRMEHIVETWRSSGEEEGLSEPLGPFVMSYSFLKIIFEGRANGGKRSKLFIRNS